jgi:hypothetical protein
MPGSTRARRQSGPRPAVSGEEDTLPDPEDVRGERLLHAVERQDELDERASGGRW